MLERNRDRWRDKDGSWNKRTMRGETVRRDWMDEWTDGEGQIGERL